jgi:hypothetical protein
MAPIASSSAVTLDNEVSHSVTYRHLLQPQLYGVKYVLTPWTWRGVFCTYAVFVTATRYASSPTATSTQLMLSLRLSV